MMRVLLRAPGIYLSSLSFFVSRIHSPTLPTITGNYDERIVPNCRSYCVFKKIYSVMSFCDIRRKTSGNEQKQNAVDVPLDRLTVTYTRSSGPGGQHVNKVNSKTEIRFHVETADWIPDDVKQRIIEKHKNDINKYGEIIIKSQKSRYQVQNLHDCLQKIKDIIEESSIKPKEPCRYTVQLHNIRLQKKSQERLKQKKLHSIKKQSRREELD
ncbi:peptidyl-tRNA hydrolase ICT1, mitochondrial [Polypterus senegalus]|uniref:peptidyl-tRNA hydrolase ICT1, mitochondrial n=1 Tax=Polypterus senegalus TaxID=55291 RepID=UPI001966802E|nr:peptidyl-tRNA hydrolase ICT1, mitochondrial [Polypterus senegalus]